VGMAVNKLSKGGATNGGGMYKQIFEKKKNRLVREGY